MNCSENVSWTEDQFLRRAASDKHRTAVVYYQLLTPLHPGDFSVTRLRSQMSWSAIPHCDLAARPAAPVRSFISQPICSLQTVVHTLRLSHQQLQGGGSLVICRNNTEIQYLSDTMWKGWLFNVQLQAVPNFSFSWTREPLWFDYYLLFLLLLLNNINIIHITTTTNIFFQEFTKCGISKVQINIILSLKLHIVTKIDLIMFENSVWRHHCSGEFCEVVLRYLELTPTVHSSTDILKNVSTFCTIYWWLITWNICVCQLLLTSVTFDINIMENITFLFTFLPSKIERTFEIY